MDDEDIALFQEDGAYYVAPRISAGQWVAEKSRSKVFLPPQGCD